MSYEHEYRTAGWLGTLGVMKVFGEEERFAPSSVPDNTPSYFTYRLCQTAATNPAGLVEKVREIAISNGYGDNTAVLRNQYLDIMGPDDEIFQEFLDAFHIFSDPALFEWLVKETAFGRLMDELDFYTTYFSDQVHELDPELIHPVEVLRHARRDIEFFVGSRDPARI